MACTFCYGSIEEVYANCKFKLRALKKLNWAKTGPNFGLQKRLAQCFKDGFPVIVHLKVISRNYFKETETFLNHPATHHFKYK